MTMYEYENTGNRVSLEDMKLEVATRPGYEWNRDGMEEFAAWLNSHHTAWEVFSTKGPEMFIEQWVQHLVETDPEMLYECTGYREARA